MSELHEYEVLQDFRDIHTREIYKKDSVIELSDERADFAIKNLKKYKGEFLKRMEKTPEESKGINAEDMTVTQLKEALDQLEVEYKANAKKDELLALLEREQEKTEQEGD